MYHVVGTTAHRPIFEIVSLFIYRVCLKFLETGSNAIIVVNTFQVISFVRFFFGGNIYCFPPFLSCSHDDFSAIKLYPIKWTRLRFSIYPLWISRCCTCNVTVTVGEWARSRVHFLAWKRQIWLKLTNNVCQNRLNNFFPSPSDTIDRNRNILATKEIHLNWRICRENRRYILLSIFSFIH